MAKSAAQNAARAMRRTITLDIEKFARLSDRSNEGLFPALASYTGTFISVHAGKAEQARLDYKE